MNWTNVSFVSGANTTNFTGVTSVSIDPKGSLAKFSGDNDRYQTTVVNDMNEPEITLECGDVGAVNSLSVGQVGTFSATLCDAVNGTGAGAITYTMANAVVSKVGAGGKHRQYGMGQVTFEAYSSDGTTNPISTSIAT
jgi:hypothetical protein